MVCKMISKNYIPLRLKMNFHSRGDFVSHSCLAFGSVAEHRFKDNFLSLSLVLLESTENYPNSATPNFFKPHVQQNENSQNSVG